MSIRSNPPLQVVGFIATRRGDADRGPQARIRGDEAERRLMPDGALVRVQGPRRNELATLAIDDSVPRGGVILRDIAGVAVSEVIHLQLNDGPRSGGGSIPTPEAQ